MKKLKKWLYRILEDEAAVHHNYEAAKYWFKKAEELK